MDSYYSIGGLRFAVTGADAQRLHEVPGFDLFRCGPGEVCFVVDTATGIPDRVDPSAVEYEFRFEETGQRCRFGRSGEGVWLVMDSEQGTMLTQYDGHGRIAMTQSHSLSQLRFALWMGYCMAGARYGRTAVHASCVEWDGRGVLFLGESGTGKSTHTRLWTEHIKGATLLNDDSPIVAVEEGGVMVYGSPWSGKTHCYRPVALPLAAAVRLRQAPHNRIKALGTLQGLAALHPSCPPAFGGDEAYTDLTLQLLGRVLEQVPVMMLECLPDADAARLSHSTIFAQ